MVSQCTVVSPAWKVLINTVQTRKLKLRQRKRPAWVLPAEKVESRDLKP